MKIEGEIWWSMDESPYLWVSDHGRVFRESFERHQKGMKGWNVPAKIITTFHKSPKGYCRLQAMGRVYFLHRVVAKYFVPNPDGKPQVNHRDGDKENNRATNLEWVTNKENRDHAVENGLHATRQTGHGKLTVKDVEEIRLNLSTGNWLQRELADIYGVCQQTVSLVREGT